MLQLHINARFLVQPRSGTQRYAEQILGELDKLIPEWDLQLEVIAWTPRRQRREPDWRSIEVRTVGNTGGHLWEQTELAFAAKNGWLLNLISSGSVIHPRQIVTFHDAALSDHPGHFSKRYALTHSMLRPLLARRAQAIITVSNFSRGALARALDVPPQKISVVPNGSDHLLRIAPDQQALTRRALAPQGYVLFVGNEAPHKNLHTALKGFRALDHPTLKFVTVGVGLASIFGELSTEQRLIERLTDVNDAELRTLYENAALLIFPSRYEGFGIPPLEAMSLGCPVVASNAAAIPEVVGDAALLVDPDDAVAMAAAMRKILQHPYERKKLIESGYERARTFSWSAAGQKLNSILRGHVGGYAMARGLA